MGNHSFSALAKSVSYRGLTIVICCINVFIALSTLCSLRSLFNASEHQNATLKTLPPVENTEDQIKKLKESIRVRQALLPVELVRVVKEVKEFSLVNKSFELSPQMKQKIADEILQKLKELPANASLTEQRASLKIWREEKLNKIAQSVHGNVRLHRNKEDAKLLQHILESDWMLLLEDVGLWLPPEIVNKENKEEVSDEALEEDIVAGPPIPADCHAEPHTDYDGEAVRWGLTHHKQNAADCCQACMDQAKRASPGEMRCNIWVYCPSEAGCYSPDIYQHKHQECWLKQAEKPMLNFKHKYSLSYRRAHSTAPLIVSWISGVITA